MRTLTIAVCLGASLDAAPPSRSPVQDQSSTSAPRVGASPTVLEFDLPADFHVRTAEGQFLIVGLRIGFFQPTVATPLATREVGRAAVEVDGGVGRVPLPDIMPPGYGRVLIRVQSLSARGGGPWSEPSPLITLPERPPPRVGPPPRLTPADVERYPALSGALQQLLGRRPNAFEVSTFRRIDDLATAVVLSRQYELALSDLCKILRGPPPLTLRGAIRRLFPTLDNRQVVRAASIEAQALLRVPGQEPG
jgi:hypothetical protein